MTLQPAEQRKKRKMERGKNIEEQTDRTDTAATATAARVNMLFGSIFLS